ncbi:GNAT family N-acetyltransferase [Amantichitinum ursilacus]|uniref:Acetyltransferase (GNAT) family protein n=1 Tax=Amantichitinum ursilacus TaxID=857265 RepID=A0A0N0XJG9_9NEIS|nr:GNAT family N-acetyltransferase [Amantichitinum ursilacus]KPC53282.1 Acetyltransferase (GNAT) family protein [Amantichitinum ursilacus]
MLQSQLPPTSFINSTDMIVTHAELAAILEHAEAQHLFQQVTALQQLSGNTAVRTQKIANGIAAFTLPEFGRKLNHVTGIAMSAAVSAAALAQLEAGYAELGLPVEIDVCPHADAAILPLLAARGYHVNAFSNSYVLPLSEADTAATDYPDIEILSGPQLADEVFIEHCIAGFAVQATSRPVSLLRALAQIAVLRADTQLFAARIDGQIAGTAGLSLLPTPGGTVAYLSITSTVPAWRQRGVQTALLQARLTAARAAGCDLASVSVRPANVSARNAERAGFRLAYTKATFSRMGVA